MNIKKTFEVSKKAFQSIKNDKRTVGLFILAPIIAILIFGGIFGNDITDINVIVVNSDEGFMTPNGEVFLSEEIISNLNSSILKITYMDDVDYASNQVEEGKYYGLFIFPENFTQNIYMKMMGSQNVNTDVIVKFDESIPIISNIIVSNLNLAISNTITEQGVEIPLSMENEPVYGDDFKKIDLFIPGIMVILTFILTTAGTLLLFGTRKTTDTIKDMLSNYKESEIVFGFGFIFIMLGLIQGSILFITASLAYDTTIAGNVVTGLFVLMLTMIVAVSLGLLIAIVSNSENRIVLFAVFTILPSLLLSGIINPIIALANWLQPFSYFIPATYAVNALKGVFLKGWGLNLIWMDILVLFIFLAVFFTVAILYLKRNKKLVEY